MSSKGQRVVYLGHQANPGTGVNVDVALRATCSLTPKVDKIQPDEDIGSLAQGRHYIGSVMPQGSLVMDGYFEHAPYMLSMALGCGGPVNGTPDVWTFPFPDDTPEEFALHSLEYSDGNAHVVRGVDVFGKSLEIKGEAGKSWVFTVELDGGAVTLPGSHTATPDPPDGVHTIRMAETTIAIDDLFADVGDTVMGELISFTLKVEDLQHSKLFSGSLSPSGRGNDKYKVTLEVIVEVENAIIAAETAKHLTTTQSAIRIQNITEDAGGEGVDYEATIDMNCMLKEFGELDDRSGNNIIKLTYELEKDASDNTGSIVLKNCLTAL